MHVNNHPHWLTFFSSEAATPIKRTTSQTDQLQPKADDLTYFFESVAATEAFGLISLLYGMLLISNSAASTGTSY